jgi:hypothetical protein
MSAKNTKSAWLDETSNHPVIDQQAQRLGTFLAAVADGKIDSSELKEQEARVVKLMQQVEPQLDGPLHEQVTQLLCELTAYDLMQVMHSMQENRPKTVFRG